MKPEVLASQVMLGSTTIAPWQKKEDLLRLYDHRFVCLLIDLNDFGVLQRGNAAGLSVPEFHG
jgi:hypothetical protein